MSYLRIQDEKQPGSQITYGYFHTLERTMFGDFQCKDCHFLCDNLETMEVHFGKCSVDELFCGLCEWKSNDLEKLETHLVSCEVYACVGCEERFLTLTDVKVHVKNEHGEKTKLKHLKMNRIASHISLKLKLSFNNFLKTFQAPSLQK